MIRGGSLSKTQNRQSASKAKDSSREASGASAKSEQGQPQRKLAREGSTSSKRFVDRAREVVLKAFPNAQGEPLRPGRRLAGSNHVSAVVLNLAAMGQITGPVQAHIRDCESCTAKLDDLKRRLAS